MFILLRLLLAHFIGDFPLQFNKIYTLKQRGLLGNVPHVLIIMGSFIAFCWPYLNIPGIWGFILFLSIVHLFQDSIKVGYKGFKYGFWLYLLDQFFHVGLIALVLFTDLRDLPKPSNSHILFVALYNDNLLIVYLIALILATYNGYYMIRSIKNTILKKMCSCVNAEKWYGMFERAALVSVFLLDKYIFLYICGILLLRPLVFACCRKRLSLNEDFIAGSEALMSWAFAIFFGLLLFIVKRYFM
ncbi:MAG: DUF3307 domain-containing protein [Candidatus Omnitrophica bacterium]|nr:DUF3307 domain-containing protein [Candidatus Omnitrophota bacterium]